MITIKLHSIIDLITNSSTELFINSLKCDKAFKKVVDEFLKTLGIDKSCDDIFTTVTLLEEFSYIDYITFDLEDNQDIKKIAKNSKLWKEYFSQIKLGKISKPPFFIDIERKFKDGRTTLLYINAKEEKYQYLADLFDKFLYSHETSESYQ